MKSLIALAIVLVVGSVAFGTDSDKKAKNASFRLVSAQDTMTEFGLVYADKNNRKMLSRVAKSHSTVHQSNDGASPSFNFENLPKRNYFTKLSDSKNYREVSFMHNIPGTAEFTESKTDIPNVNDVKKFPLVVAKYNALPVNVKNYYHQNTPVFSEVIIEQESSRKIYDLSQLEGNSFQFDIKNRNHVVTMSTK
ncbi:hypothetical protein FNH22_12050 [Fulvivirga sp. M361]|uniref:hypothetical protein n=1 Tax=Fulvivirga sp. M361 TaxID=2594266 RepID=UPI00117B1AE5|nr:hypothetical protein [Fulvivirga sp. M361]TRX58607.1 hypothetical protein FNH22_12050 [Fulvivirga sp. M361]